jgi:hypothetical protein
MYVIYVKSDELALFSVIVRTCLSAGTIGERLCVLSIDFLSFFL